MGRHVITEHAFNEELAKLAFLGNLWRGTKMIGNRLKNPVEGVRTAWKTMSPAGRMESPKAAENLIKRVQKAQSGNVLQRNLGSGSHLLEKGRKGGVKGTAEHLSRQGWTGGSRITKYLPVGDKSQLAVLGPGFVAHDMMQAPTAEDDRGMGERALSGLGYTGSMLLTAGTGVPGIAADLVASQLGGSLGRSIDKRRLTHATNMRNQKAEMAQQLVDKVRNSRGVE